MITAKEAQNIMLEHRSQQKEKYPVFKATCRLKQKYLERRIIRESKEGYSSCVEIFPLSTDKNLTYEEARCIVEDMFMYLMQYGYSLSIWLNNNTIHMEVSWGC